MNTQRKTPARHHSPSDKDFHKEDLPFYWVARIHTLYAAEMERALKTVGSDIPTWRVLAILQDQGRSSMSEIATHAIAKLPTITKLVYRMEAEGLVATSTSASDARVTEVDLTKAGRYALQRAKDATGTLFHRCFDNIPPSKLEKLNELLRLLFDNLQH